MQDNSNRQWPCCGGLQPHKIVTEHQNMQDSTQSAHLFVFLTLSVRQRYVSLFVCAMCWCVCVWSSTALTDAGAPFHTDVQHVA